MKSVNHSVCIYLFVLTYFVLTYFVPKMIVKIGKRPGRIHCKKRCDISVFNGTMAHGACLSRSLYLTWRSNLLPNAFKFDFFGKVDFFNTVEAKVIVLTWLLRGNSKGQGWPLTFQPRSSYWRPIYVLKHSFLRNHLANWTQISYGDSLSWVE